MLSLYNESWGAEDIATSEETRSYIRRVRAFLRSNHPQLLVIDNDGWEHVSTEGRLESDLLTAHVYRADLERWKDKVDRLSVGDIEATSPPQLVVGDPFFYSGQMPLVISEWGGFGFSGYGGPEAFDERAATIRGYKAALRERHDRRRCLHPGDRHRRRGQRADRRPHERAPRSGRPPQFRRSRRRLTRSRAWRSNLNRRGRPLASRPLDRVTA